MVVRVKPSCPGRVLVEENLGWCSCHLGYMSNCPFQSWAQVFRKKLLTEGLLGFLSSCCFCDLVWFLVSQKALFLSSVAAFSLAL